MKTAIVIPAYNKAAQVGAVIDGARKYGEVIVVDDGSLDSTAAVAASAGARVLAHAVNRGQGAALRTGTEAALLRGAEVVLHMDADGQHDPESIPTLLAPIEKGEVEVVYGSRFMGLKAEGMPASRKFILWGGRQFNIYALGIPADFTDPQSGLRAMTSAVAGKLDFRQDRMAHCSEILRLVARSGAKWKEVPVVVKYTAETLAAGQYRGGVVQIVWRLLLDVFRK